MKNAGVFLGGLGSVLATNLMLVGLCTSAQSGVAPAVPPPLPPPAPIVKVLPRPVEVLSEPVPLGMFLWGCGAHLSVDSDGVLPLPLCSPWRL